MAESRLLKRSSVYDGYCPICGAAGCKGACASYSKQAASKVAVSFSPGDIPQTFWAVIDLNMYRDTPELEATLEQLKAKKLKGVSGISASGQIVTDFGYRGAILRMDGPALAEQNQLSRVMYDNPNYLTSKNMAALYRLFDKDPQQGWGRQGLMHNIMDYVVQAIGSVNHPEAYNLKYYGFPTRCARIYEKGNARVDSPEELAKLLYKMICLEWKDIFNEECTTISYPDVKEATNKALYKVCKAYRSEAEWIVKNRTLTIPDNSTLVLGVDGGYQKKIDYWNTLAPEEQERQKSLGTYTYKETLEAQEKLAFIARVAKECPFKVSLVSNEKLQARIHELRSKQAAAKVANPAQFDTPAFKSWFNGSKIVDKDGNPLRCFHGTTAEFDKFDIPENKVAYFTPDTSYGHVWRGPNVLPVYLSIKNPYFTEYQQDVEGAGYWPEWIEELKGQGYDGIVYAKKEDLSRGPLGWADDKSQIVAFYANQIKSATGNTGEFNPADDRITASMPVRAHSAKAGAGCVFIAKDTRRILLALRSDEVNESGTWAVWGGGMEEGETPEQTARREAQEEAGYTGPADFEQVYVHKDGEFVYTIFVAWVPKEFTPVLNWENSDYEWCDAANWPAPLHYGLVETMSILQWKQGKLAKATKRGTLQQDQSQQFFTYLKGQGIRFRVSESGSRTCYVYTNLPDRKEFKARFSDHGEPPYKDPRLEQARKATISVDPSTGKTVEDVIALYEEMAGLVVKQAAPVRVPDETPLAERLWDGLTAVLQKTPKERRGEPIARMVRHTVTPNQFSSELFPILTEKLDIPEGMISGWSGSVPVYVVVSNEGWHSQHIFDGGMLSSSKATGPEALILTLQGSMSVNRMLDILESRTTTTTGMHEFSWLRSVLKHETTHITQHTRENTVSPKDGPDAYYNDPAEFEAYLQQILHEVDDSAMMSDPEFVRMWFAGKDNTEMLQNILESNSKSWKAVKKHLNEANKREVYKEVAKLFDARGVFAKGSRLLKRISSVDPMSIVRKLMHILPAGTPLPEIKVVNSPAQRWFGRCTWSIEGGKAPETSLIELQKRITGDEETLTRVIAHELCHHAQYFEEWKQAQAKGISLDGFAFYMKLMAEHGASFNEWANKFNAVYGQGYVSHTTDDAMVVEESVVKPVYVLLWKKEPQKVYWCISFRPGPKQKGYIKRYLASETDECRLTTSKDRLILSGAPIGNGWSVPNSPEKMEKLLALWNDGPEAKIASAKLLTRVASSLPVKLKDVTIAEVLENENKANASGKHEGNPAHQYSAPEKRFNNTGPHVLINAPVRLLNHEHDAEDPDYMGTSDATKKRIDDYASRTTEAPPIYLTFSGYSAKRGGIKAFVSNGNHRVAAAVKAGRSTIKAYMPTEDFERWMTVLTTPKQVSARLLQRKDAQVVFHGSPYDFEAFKTDNIGSGEGEQMFGWGLYFTDTEAVARGYQESSRGKGQAPRIEDFPKQFQVPIYRALDRPNGSLRDSAIAGIREKLTPEYAALLDELAGLKGTLFEAEVPDGDVYLLWDAPQSQQPPVVKKLMGSTPSDYYTGGHWYNTNARRFGGAKALSLWLRSQGVLGVKYLDGNSRGKGNGTYNYVIFDDKDVRVTKKSSAKTASPVWLDYMRDACDAVGAGFYFEEGGCYGMALALFEELRRLDPSAVVWLRKDYAHAYAKAFGRLWDYQGSSPSYEGTPFTDEADVVAESGGSREEIQNSKAYAEEVISTAKELAAKACKDASAKTANVATSWPHCGPTCDGLTVTGKVPNAGSISASLDNYKVLEGIREVPMDAFNAEPHQNFAAANDLRRVHTLAEQIKANGWIDPLIVVIDEEGPYILEGGHRLCALFVTGKTSFPAMVVLDQDGPGGGGKEAKKASETLYHGTNAEFDAFEIKEGWRGVSGLTTELVKSHAVFLSDNPEFSKEWGERILECSLRPGLNILDLTGDNNLRRRFQDAPHEWVYDEAVHGSVPVAQGDEAMDVLYKAYTPNEAKGIALHGRYDWELTDNPAFIKALKESGFDGIKFEEVAEDSAGTTWAILNPQDVKIEGVMKDASTKMASHGLSDIDLHGIRQFRSEIRLSETGKDEPSSGQCGWVAEDVYNQFHFEVASGFYLKDGPNTPHTHSDHVWNVLPDGSIFDATHDQFGYPDILVAAPGSPEAGHYHEFCEDPYCPHCTCEMCNPDRAEEAAVEREELEGRKQARVVFHGTPHDFEEFKLDHIGTGEGAQAQGWGLYFTDTEGVATYYRDSNIGKNELTVSDVTKLLEDAAGDTKIPHVDFAARGLMRAESWNAKVDSKVVAEKAQAANTDLKAIPAENLAEIVDKMRNVSTGKIFEVEIPDGPYLDWDKAMQDQDPKVKAILELDDPGNAELLAMTGSAFYESQAAFWGGHNTKLWENYGGGVTTLAGNYRATSEHLHKLGIAGVKYLDANSRGKGDGTYNYVVFSDRDIKVIKKASAKTAKLLTRKNKTATPANKVWLAESGKVVKVPAGHEHAEYARTLLGEDFDPDFEKDAFTEALKEGWIRVGAASTQTWVMVWKLDRDNLAAVQTYLMKHPEMARGRITIEEAAEGLIGTTAARHWYGDTADFLTFNKPSDVWRQKAASASEPYPIAGATVDGLTVGSKIPNQGSIAASLEDYEVLKGVRVLSMSSFDADPADMFPAANDHSRVRVLAEQIKVNGYIDPLIVVVDADGPYVLEGAHRLCALFTLGKTEFPALVVLDGDGGPGGGKESSLKTAAYSKAWIAPGPLTDASFVDVDREHAFTASDICDAHGISPAPGATPERECEIPLLQRGWIRAGFKHDHSYFEVGKMTQATLETLQAVIQEDPTGDITVEDGAKNAWECSAQEFLAINRVGDLRHYKHHGFLVRGAASTVLYHGTRSTVDTPKPSKTPHKILWATEDKQVADNYANTSFRKEGEPVVWEITLKPGVQIVDFKDVDHPVVRSIKEAFSTERRLTMGYAVSDEKWVRDFADFGVLEAYPWITKRLKALGVYALRVKDISHMLHGDKVESVAILTDKVIASARVVKEAKVAKVVFHGTPHDFDKFHTKGIGTGEGRQEYGWGLYFTESEGAAASYRDYLAKGGPGKLMDADIPEGPYLDWDTLLMQQAQEVKDILNSLALTVPPQARDTLMDKRNVATSGDSVYLTLAQVLGSPKKASQTLRKAGIVGIRYFDATPAPDGKGVIRAHSYVVFDAKDIRVLRKAKVASGTFPDFDFAAKPWRMTEEEFKANPPHGFIYKERGHGTEVGEATPNGIVLTSRLWRNMPDDADARYAVVMHELGHYMSDYMLNDGSAFTTWKEMLQHFRYPHVSGQTTPGEVWAELYSIYMWNPEDLDWQGWDGLRPLVESKVQEYGFPKHGEIPK